MILQQKNKNIIPYKYKFILEKVFSAKYADKFGLPVLCG
jgi:hypothetical protein